MYVLVDKNNGFEFFQSLGFIYEFEANHENCT